jgi:hypothetical protein
MVITFPILYGVAGPVVVPDRGGKKDRNTDELEA